MPFDAINASEPASVPLRHVLRPVPARLLQAHREAQSRRFGPNAWYRHRRVLACGLLALVGLMAASAAWAPPGLLRAFGCALPFGALAGFAALVAAGRIRLRGGAQWQERWVAPADLAQYGVPEEIASLACRVQAESPAARLVLGELVEDAAVLDPYLLVERDGDRLCLGIWDDAGIVAVAG